MRFWMNKLCHTVCTWSILSFRAVFLVQKREEGGSYLKVYINEILFYLSIWKNVAGKYISYHYF